MEKRSGEVMRGEERRKEEVKQEERDQYCMHCRSPLTVLVNCLRSQDRTGCLTKT
jgi:hypothetical protein